MTDFPATIYSPRAKSNRPNIEYDPDAETTLFAEDVSKLDDEVVALEENLQDKVNRVLIVVPIDPDTVVPVGDGLYTFTIPANLNGYNFISAQAAFVVANVTGDMTIDIYNIAKSHSVLSSEIQIDEGEKTSEDSEYPSAIDTDYDDVSTGDEIRIDITSEADTAKGLQVFLTFVKPIS